MTSRQLLLNRNKNHHLIVPLAWLLKWLILSAIAFFWLIYPVFRSWKYIRDIFWVTFSGFGSVLPCELMQVLNRNHCPLWELFILLILTVDSSTQATRKIEKAIQRFNLQTNHEIFTKQNLDQEIVAWTCSQFVSQPLSQTFQQMTPKRGSFGSVASWLIFRIFKKARLRNQHCTLGL